MGQKLERWRLRACIEKRGFDCRRRLFCAMLAAALGTGSLLAGEEPGQKNDEAHQAREDAETLVVKLQEGAESPRAAISAFVAAANAADLEAMLMLVDPQFRPLVRTEVLLEEYILEQHLLRNFLMNRDERMSPLNNLGAIPIVYAKRDLLRTSQIKILNERPSNRGANRRLLDVDWKVRSWQYCAEDNSFDYLRVTILAVQRQDRWYLFHPFGAILRTLEYTPEDAEGVGLEENGVLQFERQEQANPQTSDAHYRLEYRVPIEVVHEELVSVAQSPIAAKMFDNTQHLLRFLCGVQNQFLRGDIETLDDLDTALAKGNPALESLATRYLESFEPVIGKLHQKLKAAPQNK